MLLGDHSFALACRGQVTRGIYSPSWKCLCSSRETTESVLYVPLSELVNVHNICPLLASCFEVLVELLLKFVEVGESVIFSLR